MFKWIKRLLHRHTWDIENKANHYTTGSNRELMVWMIQRCSDPECYECRGVCIFRGQSYLHDPEYVRSIMESDDRRVVCYRGKGPI